MRTRGFIAAVLLALWVVPARAQVVVMDPSQIAASAVNAADQIDYMISQLGELADVHDKLKSVHDYIDDVFGEDGAGGRTISVLEDLGTLDRLTRSYNSTLDQTKRYMEMMKAMEQYGLSDANTILRYMNSMKDQVELAVRTARHILSTLGFSRKEKKDELEKIINDMEEELALTGSMVRIETEATMMAEGIAQLDRAISEMFLPETYIESTRHAGTMKGTGEAALGNISKLLMMLSVLMGAWGLYVFSRGSIEGDPMCDNIYLRVASSMMIGLFIINLLAQAGGFNL